MRFICWGAGLMLSARFGLYLPHELPCGTKVLTPYIQPPFAPVLRAGAKSDTRGIPYQSNLYNNSPVFPSVLLGDLDNL